MYYKNEIDEILLNITDKNIAKNVMSARALISKLEEKDIEDSELSEKFGTLHKELVRYQDGENGADRVASNKMLEIVLYADQKHNLVRKGSLKSKHAVRYGFIGVVIGLALFLFSTALYLAISIAVGIGIGLIKGTVSENKAEKEGRLY